jgi:hypothetical protein
VSRRRAAFLHLVAVFIDMLGMGIVFPCCRRWLAGSRQSEAQSYWFSALAVSYGVMQFFCARSRALSNLRAAADLITSIVGLGLHYH